MDRAVAIEANGAEFLMEIGRAAGGEVRDDARVRWAIGNSPIDYFNCVVFADLAREGAGAEILASIESLRTHGVPGSWHVGPSMRPPDLGERLVTHGFEYGGDDIGMAIDLSALPGFTVGVLGSSEMGYPVYRRLGFQEYCRISLYEWRPG